jgi:hypothetical protein
MEAGGKGEMEARAQLSYSSCSNFKYKTLRRFGMLLGRRGLPQRERRKTPDGCGRTPDGCGRLLRTRQR